MCFRPAGVTKPIECSKCGKKITPMGGVTLKKCPFCGTEFAAPAPEPGPEAKPEEKPEEKK